jgi:hypothetical protein
MIGTVSKAVFWLLDYHGLEIDRDTMLAAWEAP